VQLVMKLLFEDLISDFKIFIIVSQSFLIS
jgi:hypothetical protein